jgi:hypothetical protein
MKAKVYDEVYLILLDNEPLMKGHANAFFIDKEDAKKNIITLALNLLRDEYLPSWNATDQKSKKKMLSDIVNKRFQIITYTKQK